MSIYDASSITHPIPEYQTSKHGIIYINIICKDKKIKRWSSNGKVLWSLCVYGSLLNGLDQDFGLCSGSLLKWHSLLSWSYGLWWFKEVRNGVRGLVCVIPGCAGLFSSDAWLQGSIDILATSLGFARCFCKPSSISQVNFPIWRPFRCLEVISQPFQSLEIISQKSGMFTDHFLKLGAFSQPFWSLEIISHPFQSSKVISQLKIDFAAHFAASKWGELCC